jgi:hypothetical protein
MLVTPVNAAGSPNAAEIVRQCATLGNAPTDECQSYVNGLITGVMMDQIGREQGTPICLPDSVTTDEVRSQIVAYIRAHPDFLARDGNQVVGVALMTMFACKR